MDSTITTSTKTKNDWIQPLNNNNSQQQQKGSRYCVVCHQPCLRNDKTLIRALGEIYHFNCFKCEECHILVADKFYALENGQNTKKMKIVCEQHYYSQLGELCNTCHLPLPKNTIKQQLNYCQCPTKCPGCLSSTSPTTTANQYKNEAWYEYNGQVYCKYHFSSFKDTQCAGCHQAVLQQFVEHKSFPNKKWHPECYMIFKFWNVRLADTLNLNGIERLTANQLDEIQKNMEKKVNQVWTDLSSFEESSATCISDLLMLMAAGAHVEGFRMACQFIAHIEVLFIALDDLQKLDDKNVLPCEKETKSICHQIIRFFNLLVHPNNNNNNINKINNNNNNNNNNINNTIVENDLSVTQSLICLVTLLAQNLKSLIRVGLSSALNLERDYHIYDAIPRFLNNLLELERKRVWIGGRYWFKEDPIPNLIGTSSIYNISTLTLSTQEQNQCYGCQLAIDDDCFQYKYERWHPQCFHCSNCHRSLTQQLVTSQFLMHKTSKKYVLVCSQCFHITKNYYYLNLNDPTTFSHLSRLQHYLFLLKLALARLYYITNSQDATLKKQIGPHDYHMLQQSFNNNNINSNNNNNNNTTSSLLSNQQYKQHTRSQSCSPTYLGLNGHQQQSLHRNSFFGSVRFGNIKRAKSAHLDRISEHPQDHEMKPNNNTLHRRSFGLYQRQKTNKQKQKDDSFEDQQQHIPTLSTATVTSTPINHSLDDLSSPTSPTPSSINNNNNNNNAFKTATKRASSITLNRIGSLRRAFSQRNNNERGSIYHIFDRPSSQNQSSPAPTIKSNDDIKNKKSCTIQNEEYEEKDKVEKVDKEDKKENQLEKKNIISSPILLPTSSLQQHQHAITKESRFSAPPAPLQHIHCSNGTNESLPTLLSSSSSSSSTQLLLELNSKQYFLTRHLAAKIISEHHDHVLQQEHALSLDDIMSLVDGNSNNHTSSSHRTSLWGKLKNKIRPSQVHTTTTTTTMTSSSILLPTDSTFSTISKNNNHQLHNNCNNKKKVFGLPLELVIDFDQQRENDENNQKISALFFPLIEKIMDDGQGQQHQQQLTLDWTMNYIQYTHCKVPLFIQHCILALIQRDVTVEGIFRKNGNIREIKELEQVIDQDDAPNYINLFQNQSTIQLAALLKRFLRELPEPLLTFKLYPLFMAAIGLSTEHDIKRALHLVCCMLPKENRDTMQLVFGFLRYVSAFSEKNKMGIYNLARIMAPTVLFQSPSPSDQSSLKNNNSIIQTPSDEIQIVEYLIQYHDEFAKTPDNIIYLISNNSIVDYFANIETKNFIKCYNQWIQNKNNFTKKIQSRTSTPNISFKYQNNDRNQHNNNSITKLVIPTYLKENNQQYHDLQQNNNNNTINSHMNDINRGSSLHSPSLIVSLTSTNPSLPPTPISTEAIINKHRSITPDPTPTKSTSRISWMLKSKS